MAKTLIGSTLHIEGEISGDEDLEILGSVKGKIVIKENLIVREKGKAEAEIETRSVEIFGSIIGNINASEKIEIKPSGRVNGNLKSPRVMIHDGAHFIGNIDMSRKE